MFGLVDIDAMRFWVTQLSNRDKDTVDGYKVYFLKFCEWLGKGPNELIEMKKQALEHNGDRRENMVLEGKVKQFMSHLEKDAVWYTDRRNRKGKRTGYGLGTRKIAFAAIVSFFDLNQYPLSMKRGDRPTGDAIGSRIPEKSEIVKLVNTAKSRRYRAIILFLKDSGLRLSDVVKLRWRDIQDFGEGFFGFRLITAKRKVKALPFVGPETTEALKQLPHKKKRIFPVNTAYLSAAISELIREAGLNEGFTAHGLRKYFNTELEAARVPKEYRYAMMGKRTSVYDENRQTRLFQIYKQNYDHLRIFGVVDREEEIESLKETIRDQQRELDHIRESGITRTQFNNLKEQLLELEKKMKAIR